MRKVKIHAPAKLNLFFRILAKRKDGYHSVETIIEKISIFDTLTLKESSSNNIIIKSDSREISSLGRKNLIYKTADLLKRKLHIKQGVSIDIVKNIPLGAGLGGGSSDAAATIMGLNDLWKLRMSKCEQVGIAKSIGSDVALFMENRSFLFGEERGEKMSHIRGVNKFKLWHVVVVSDFRISTPAAYGLYDRHYFSSKTQNNRHVFGKNLKLTIPGYSANIIACALCSRDVSLLNYYSYNSFKNIICKQFPELAKLKRRLEKISGEIIHLSGSGSSLFFNFATKRDAEQLARKLRKCLHRCRCFVVFTH